MYVHNTFLILQLCHNNVTCIRLHDRFMFNRSFDVEITHDIIYLRNDNGIMWFHTLGVCLLSVVCQALCGIHKVWRWPSYMVSYRLHKV